MNQTRSLTRWTPRFAGITTIEGPDSILHIRAVTVNAPPRLPGAWRALSRGVHPTVSWLGHQCRLIHAHFVTDALTILPTAQRVRRPLIVTAHGYDITTDPARFGHRFSTRWSDLVSYVSTFVAVSDFIAGKLSDRGVPDHKIRQLPIGIPIPPPPTSAGNREGVLFVGRLVEKKRPDHLLRAMANGEGLRATTLTFIGDGPLRDGLESISRRSSVATEFLGRQPPERVQAAMEAAAIFCMPSLAAADGDAEGFGMVFLEAAAAELPCVAYATPGVNEAVEDGRTGLLARSGDIADLADRLLRLIDNPVLARTLGAAGRRRVTSEFDIVQHTGALEDLYDEVVAEWNLRARR